MRRSLVLSLTLLLAPSGCASLATGALADALSGSGGGLGRDDDPELVAAAAPFGLKTMESVLVSQPEHLGLLTALAGGFVQYAAAFVAMPADIVATTDLPRAEQMRARAKKLLLRGRNYGLRGLEVEHAGVTAALRQDPVAALATMEPDDVPLMYWTAAAWGLAISTARMDTELLADIPVVQALPIAAWRWPPSGGDGTIYELALSLELVRPGGSTERAEALFASGHRGQRRPTRRHLRVLGRGRDRQDPRRRALPGAAREGAGHRRRGVPGRSPRQHHLATPRALAARPRG
jgi:hypothetical protein